MSQLNDAKRNDPQLPQNEDEIESIRNSIESGLAKMSVTNNHGKNDSKQQETRRMSNGKPSQKRNVTEEKESRIQDGE